MKCGYPSPPLVTVQFICYETVFFILKLASVPNFCVNSSTEFNIKGKTERNFTHSDW